MKHRFLISQKRLQIRCCTVYMPTFKGSRMKETFVLFIYGGR
uniref:Uncharacterized protein n=1 Tax=Arundo donax TaxID=35708 RepID=A0A0A9AFH3_ARUDO